VVSGMVHRSGRVSGRARLLPQKNRVISLARSLASQRSIIAQSSRSIGRDTSRSTNTGAIRKIALIRGYPQNRENAFAG
jgi:hypothetical protein